MRVFDVGDEQHLQGGGAAGRTLRGASRWWRRGVRSTLQLIVAAIFMLTSVGCVDTLDRVRADAASAYAVGRIDQAARILDTPEAVNAHAKRSKLLWNLERGALALYLGDYANAIARFDVAETDAAYQYDPSAGDVLAQWTFNDTASRYTAQPYEDMYINVMKQLAYLAMGKVDGFATAESRRHLGKAAHLRDVYGKYMGSLNSGQNAAYVRQFGGSGAPGVNREDAGQFIESTLGTYLAMMIFTHTGEANLQEQTARSLRDAIEKQGAVTGEIDLKNLDGAEQLRASDFNLLVVALSGRGPMKVEGSLPVAGLGMPIEYPRLIPGPRVADAAYLEVEGDEGEQELFLIEDLGRTAIENYRRAEPAQYARTMIRLGGKIGLATAATIIAHNQRDTRDYAGLIAMAGAIAIIASEQADLRGWSMLQGQARVGHVRLKQGPHRVRVRYERREMVVHVTPWEDIDVGSGRLTTIVSHYPGGR
jgi:hypothetical protein